MSRHQVDFVIGLPRAGALAACRAALESVGWPLAGQSDDRVVGQEIVGPFSFKAAVTVDMSLSGNPGGPTTIVLTGSNLGLGPIQSPHVKTQVQRIREAIEAAAARPAPSPAASPSTAHPSAGSSSRSVIINGQRLSDQQIEAVGRSCGVRFADGDFWYDKIIGAWGYRGGPAMGFVLAGLDLGGPLAEDASNGNTGVFINGRHLHIQDVVALQQIVPMVWPGRYWMDAYGNVGLEGGMMLGNIWALAQSSGTPREGILSTYDKTGAVVIG